MEEYGVSTLVLSLHANMKYKLVKRVENGSGQHKNAAPCIRQV